MFEGSQINFPNKCVLKFIIANSADPDDMQQTTKLPLQGFPVYKGLLSLPLSDELKNIKKIFLAQSLDIMFVASSCEPLPSLFKLCLWRPKMAPPRMSHVLFIEVLHPVNFVNITHVMS